MSQYRAEFDATVIFSNGGGLHAQGFRVDLPHAGATEDEIAALFVASLSLLMVERVVLTGVRIFAEPHKGTRGGPSDVVAAAPPAGTPLRWVELSHTIPDGAEFGTSLTGPYDRYADGADLAGLPLTSLVDLPAVVVRTAGSGVRGVDVGALAALDVAGRAVLLHTGGDAGWGTDAYAEDAPYLTGAGAAWLVERGAALVGIDAVNIDDVSGAGPGERPAHSLLLAAGIPVVEHLTGLDRLPPSGARFTAAPPRLAGLGRFPVRAYASVPVAG